MSEISQDGPCKDPFEQALEAVLSGDATRREEVILNETLRIDPDARKQYVRAMVFEGMLAREFAPLDEPAVRGRNRWVVGMAIAAAVAVAAFPLWHVAKLLKGGRMAGAVEGGNEDISYAVITSLQDASGRIGTAALVPGLRLVQGVLELDRGLAEITFDSGAEVTLEGPARFELESDNRSKLSAGRASAVVPEQARGFVIHTPTSFIRDLGTAFAVEVKDDRETDVHVIEGEVEVAPTGSQSPRVPKILREKEAVRLSDGTMLAIGFRSESPGQKSAKRAPRVPESVHWSFDSWDGGQAVDAVRGVPFDLQARGGKPVQPELVEGIFGAGLHFSGDGVSGRTGYRAMSAAQARTFACWVCFPAGGGGGPQGMLSWGGGKGLPRWQFLLNPMPGHGAVGAARVEYGDGYVVGATDLRDGRWHHLAMVFLGGARANVASHVRIYVDGKLEPITGRQAQVIQAGGRGAEVAPLVVGRYPARGEAGRVAFFRGELDELHVFEGALLPGQIVRLMRRNELPPLRKGDERAVPGVK